jgi:hypothetical protein
LPPPNVKEFLMWAYIQETINLYMHREKAGEYVPPHFQRGISRPGMPVQEPICGKREETCRKCSIDGITRSYFER